MADYSMKSYGRNAEVAELFGRLKAGKDISQHGPRRLGKTFVLERMVEQASAYGFICVKVEIPGCTDQKTVFRQLCGEIGNHRSLGKKTVAYLTQRMSQVLSPRGEQVGPWYQPILGVDWESYLERLLGALQDDPGQQWAILIDELPIFLKALHDKGEVGVKEARDFMNLFSRLRAAKPRVRWLITGSIGIDPLAKVGQYTGALAKFDNFELKPLSEPQAHDYLRDLARIGSIQSRSHITDPEAQAITDAVGWRAAYYLEALARHLPPNPETDAAKVEGNIAAAMSELLKQHNSATFGVWEEHLRKHHPVGQRQLSFDILNALARHPAGLTLDGILASMGDAVQDREQLRHHLFLMIAEGFLLQEPYGDEAAPYRFRLVPLQSWWALYRPQP